MMEYNPNYVYFEPVKDMLDKWCIAADSVYNIKNILTKDDESIKEQLVQIKGTNDDCSYPFKTSNDDCEEWCPFKFVYVDPAFQLMMREIYIGIDPQIGLTYSINSNKFKHVYYKTSSIEDAKEWVAKRRKFEAAMGAWEDGAEIEARYVNWTPEEDPLWSPNVDYRVKPDKKVLEWTDLDIGNIIRSKTNRTIYMQVQGIDTSADTSEHIFAGAWLSNDDLVDWEKVDEEVDEEVDK